MERTHGGSLLGSATPRYPREGGATECRPRRSRGPRTGAHVAHRRGALVEGVFADVVDVEDTVNISVPPDAEKVCSFTS